MHFVLRGYALTQTTTNEQIVLHYKRAEAALKVGESQTAAAEFKEILKLDPGNAEASANLGVIEPTNREIFRRLSSSLPMR